MIEDEKDDQRYRPLSINHDYQYQRSNQEGKEKAFKIDFKNDISETESNMSEILQEDVQIKKEPGEEENEIDKPEIRQVSSKFRLGKWKKSRKHYILCCKFLKGR